MATAEKSWSEAWSDVDDKIGGMLSTYFEQFDVTDPATYAGKSKYLEADLFTMVYFASEIYHCRSKASPFFESLFAGAKKGALFLYIDNSSNTFSDWFDKLYSKHGIEVVKQIDDGKAFLPNDEQKTDLGVHYTRLKGQPKLTGQVSLRLLRKL